MIIIDPCTLEAIDTETEAGQEWTRARQRELGGLVVDGDCGPRTLARLREAYGEPPSSADTLPLPRMVYRWKYWHAHMPDDTGWPMRDDYLTAATSGGAWQDGMVRLVAGYSAERDTWSRPPWSLITLDTLSLGIAHWWAKRLPSVLPALMEQIPDLEGAVGADMAALLLDGKRLARLLGDRRGRQSMTPRLLPLVRAWWSVADSPEMMCAQANLWLDDVLPTARSIIKDHHLADDLDREHGGRLLAAVSRMVNSSPARARRALRHGQRVAARKGLLAMLEATMSGPRSQGGYDHPERWAKIKSWREFDGRAPQEVGYRVEDVRAAYGE